MKVLCLTNSFPTKANPQMGIFVKEQIDSLRLLGVKVTIINIKGYDDNLNYLKAIGKLWKTIRCRKFDLIHAHYGLSGLITCTQFALPAIVTFHGGEVLGAPSKSGWFINRMLVWLNEVIVRCARAVIVQSDEMKKRLGFTKAMIIPFGVDFCLFKPIDRKEACYKLNLDAGRKRILFANNPAIPLKQFALAQKVFDLVRSNRPETDLVITGKTPRENMPLYMNACDVLILTSLFEGSPNVVKEAMACNLPIVSVDVGDVREVIGKTENCFVTSRNPAEMAERIVQIFDSGQRTKGRENIRHLEIGNIARRILDLYETARLKGSVKYLV